MRFIVPAGKVVEIVEDTTIDITSLPPTFAALRDDRPRPHEEGYLAWLDGIRAAVGRPLPRSRRNP